MHGITIKVLPKAVCVREKAREKELHRMPLIFHTMDWGGNLLAIIDDT